MSHPAQNLKLSNIPQKAAEEMLRIIQDLHDVYVRETDFLTESNTKGFFSLQDEKEQITRRYEQGMRQMLARKEEMKTVSQAIKDALRLLQEKFTQVAQKNREMLERMQRTTERLSNTIRNAAKEAVNKRTSGGYGSNGSLTMPSTRNMSIGINETI